MRELNELPVGERYRIEMTGRVEGVGFLRVDEDKNRAWKNVKVISKRQLNRV